MKLYYYDDSDTFEDAREYPEDNTATTPDGECVECGMVGSIRPPRRAGVSTYECGVCDAEYSTEEH